MKKYVTGAAMLLMAGCTAVMTEPDLQMPDETGNLHSESMEKMFYSSLEGEPDTKTFVDEQVKMLWHADDRISIFSTTLNEQFRFNGETGDNSGTFSRIKTGEFSTGFELDRHYAVYPYEESTKIGNDGILTVMLPSEQAYAYRSFAQGSNTMVAVTGSIEDTFLGFRNLGGFLKLQVYGDGVVRSIRLTGNAGEKIAGKALVTARFGEMPEVSMTEEAGTEIVLNCGEGVSLGGSEAEATDFWIVIPPVTFEHGLTVEITDDRGRLATKSTDKQVEITRNAVLPMSAFEAEIGAGNSLLTFRLGNGTVAENALGISGDKISVALPYGTDISAMTAVFTTDGYQVLVDGLEQKSGETANDFSAPVTYTVQSKAGESRSYTVNVYCFDLPAVYITTPGQAAITSKTEWMKNAALTLHAVDGTVTALGAASIRGRGNSTWGYPKKPYALKLDKKSEVLGMPKDKRWNLLANWMDRTNMRNVVAFEVSRKTASLAWTPRGRFVELILNGTHLGNYYLCEHIKVAENRVNITEMKSTDTDPESITGGYLMELDTYYDEKNKFRSNTLNLPVQFKSPDDDVMVPEQLAYIQSYFNEAEALITSDDIAANSYKDYIDIDTYIDWWFVQELAGNGEPNHPKSSYMHKDRGGKLKAGPCWDYDWGTFTPLTSWRIKSAIWYAYLFKDPAFVARVKEKWSESKPGFLSVLSFIEEQAGRLAHSDEMDSVLWPLEGKSSVNGDETLTFKDAVERMRSNYEARIEWMDAQISALQ